MKDRLETIIRDWLNTEFHNPNALPGLLISGLAQEIDRHRGEIFSHVNTEYHLEDIDSRCESNDTTLTADERSMVLHRYEKLEDSNLDELSYIIDEVVAERRKSDDSESKKGE